MGLDTGFVHHMAASLLPFAAPGESDHAVLSRKFAEIGSALHESYREAAAAADYGPSLRVSPQSDKFVSFKNVSMDGCSHRVLEVLGALEMKKMSCKQGGRRARKGRQAKRKRQDELCEFEAMLEDLEPVTAPAAGLPNQGEEPLCGMAYDVAMEGGEGLDGADLGACSAVAADGGEWTDMGGSYWYRGRGVSGTEGRDGAPERIPSDLSLESYVWTPTGCSPEVRLLWDGKYAGWKRAVNCLTKSESGAVQMKSRFTLMPVSVEVSPVPLFVSQLYVSDPVVVEPGTCAMEGTPEAWPNMVPVTQCARVDGNLGDFGCMTHVHLRLERPGSEWMQVDCSLDAVPTNWQNSRHNGRLYVQLFSLDEEMDRCASNDGAVFMALVTCVELMHARGGTLVEGKSIAMTRRLDSLLCGGLRAGTNANEALTLEFERIAAKRLPTIEVSTAGAGGGSDLS